MNWPALVLVLLLAIGAAVGAAWWLWRWRGERRNFGQVANPRPRPPLREFPSPEIHAVERRFGVDIPEGLRQLHAIPQNRHLLKLRDVYFRGSGRGCEADVFIAEFVPLTVRAFAVSSSLSKSSRRVPFARDWGGREYFVYCDDQLQLVWRFDMCGSPPMECVGVSLKELLRREVGYRGLCGRCGWDCSRSTAAVCQECGQELPRQHAA
jgi:hypothetical protein